MVGVLTLTLTLTLTLRRLDSRVLYVAAPLRRHARHASDLEVVEAWGEGEG